MFLGSLQTMSTIIVETVLNLLKVSVSYLLKLWNSYIDFLVLIFCLFWSLYRLSLIHI